MTLKADLNGTTSYSMVCESREECVLFSSFTASCYDLTSKAKNAVLCIMQKLRMLNNNSFELFLKLFDSQVQQSLSMVVSYGVLILQRFIAERSTYLR